VAVAATHRERKPYWFACHFDPHRPYQHLLAHLVIQLRKIQVTSAGDFRVMRRLALAAFVLLGMYSAAAQSSDDAVRSVTNALRAHQYDQAYKLAHAKLQESPNDPKILTLEGLALSGLGKKSGALADYDAALKVAPNYVPALEAAAELEYNAGRRAQRGRFRIQDEGGILGAELSLK
jgi:tetratricopeptide (TPR) repeat protein